MTLGKLQNDRLLKKENDYSKLANMQSSAAKLNILCLKCKCYLNNSEIL